MFLSSQYLPPYSASRQHPFVALLAAAGVAIGWRWPSNFAAGAFLIILRPFKLGDMISAAGVTGDVREIGFLQQL